MNNIFSIFTFIYTSCILSGCTGNSSQNQAEISGELMKWHRITLTFSGPESSESDPDNPFLNYNLTIRFTHNFRTYLVPGYFAGDGDAAESSADSGDKWRVHFRPDEVGTWKYEVVFKKGINIAVAGSDGAGESGGFMDGLNGEIEVVESNKYGSDFRSKGRLEYVDKRYLRFAETGEYFLKAGADAPENLLAYADFDGDFKTDSVNDQYIKTWEPHFGDWRDGDPVWKENKGKGLIGAINYLSSKGMNAISFIPMNIAGDDKNVFPYVSYHNYDRIDISRMDQWEIVFDHAQKMGLFLHFKTSEVENQGLLDNGELGIHRKLYYRELIARFGHHLALNWNIGEENGKWMDDHPTPWQTTEQRLACARYFYENDPYRHHIVIHNGQDFLDLLGSDSRYTGISLQTDRRDFGNVHSQVLRWRQISEDVGKNWAIAVDEPGDHQYSLVPDDVDSEHDEARQNALWGALMGGAWGIEWYFGYLHEHSDLTCEDWRSRDVMWDQSRYALDFFEKNKIPFWELEPLDDLTDNKHDYVLADPGNHYVVYSKMRNKDPIVLQGLTGEFVITWYNAKTGAHLREFQATDNDGEIILHLPENDVPTDWAVYVRLSE